MAGQGLLNTPPSLLTPLSTDTRCSSLPLCCGDEKLTKCDLGRKGFSLANRLIGYNEYPEKPRRELEVKALESTASWAAYTACLGLVPPTEGLALLPQLAIKRMPHWIWLRAIWFRDSSVEGSSSQVTLGCVKFTAEANAGTPVGCSRRFGCSKQDSSTFHAYLLAKGQSSPRHQPGNCCLIGHAPLSQ